MLVLLDGVRIELNCVTPAGVEELWWCGKSPQTHSGIECRILSMASEFSRFPNDANIHVWLRTTGEKKEEPENMTEKEKPKGWQGDQVNVAKDERFLMSK